MKCPIDNTGLQMTERQGVEIDYCPKCRGVWLDRGELDKMIDRVEEGDGAQGAESWGTSPSKTRRQNSQQHDDEGGGGLLSALFDF